MNEIFSKAFLLAWILFPGLAFLLSLGLKTISPLTCVGMAALFCAGFLFPFELDRRRKNVSTGVLALLLFLFPFVVAAGRIEMGDWSTIAVLGLVGIWLALMDFLWGWARARGIQVLPHYLFLFLFLSFGGPFLNYLLLDFGQRSFPILSDLSPFHLVLAFVRRTGFEAGALWIVGLFSLVFWLRKKLEIK